MSNIVYDQNYAGIPGVNFPDDGTVFYQQDFMKEQFSIGSEIINREQDYFTPGVIEGFGVTVSSVAGCIDVCSGLARDIDGQRIYKDNMDELPVPDLETKILIIRHVWEFEPYVLDGTSDEKMHRKNDSSFEFYNEGEVPENAIQLCKIQRSGDSVTILEDLRVFTRLKEQFYEAIVGGAELDTDVNLTANSDDRVPSQRAVRTTKSAESFPKFCLLRIV